MPKKKQERELTPERKARLQDACRREIEAADREIERTEREASELGTTVPISPDTRGQGRDLAPVPPGKAATASRRGLGPDSPPEVLDRTARRMIGSGYMTSNVLAYALKTSLGTQEAALDVTDGIMRAVFEDVKPRGQIEKMLAEQLVLLHGQALATNIIAVETSRPDQRERALNTASRLLSDFRKTLGALQAYREPPRQVIHARQVNQAGQQVIVNGDVNPNELGTSDAQ